MLCSDWLQDPLTNLGSIDLPSVSTMKRGAPDPPQPARVGPLFQFQFTPTNAPRNWRNVVQRQRYRATVNQTREARDSDDLGGELTTALSSAIETQLQNSPNLEQHHAVHFTLQSDHFSHAFQSATFTVREFQEDSERLRTYLQSLADKLNSNEDFEADDSFTAEITLVRTPGTGGRGKRDRGRVLGRQSLEKMLKSKKSIIPIRNNDDLCCARALVTVKALVDADGDHRNPDYVNLRKGRPLQGSRARELHALADVAEGSCGHAELLKFQKTLPDYQIKVMSIDKPHMITFAGPDKNRRLLLLKVADHYHACTSFSGFLDTSYFCHECNKGYNNEERSKHPCNGKWCNSCNRRNCTDFKAAKEAAGGKYPTPTRLCSSCNRHFHGDECYEKHLASTSTQRSHCEMWRVCLVCRSQYEAAPHKRAESATHPKYQHKCGFAICPFCDEYVSQQHHKCYIQPVKEDEDEPKLLCVKPSEVGERNILRVDPDTGGCYVEANTPLFVYADYEATTDDQGVQTPIMLCCESAEEEETTVFYGGDCTERFFDYLDELTVDDYGDSRRVIVIFHNFKGYDGMFIIKYLYDNHRHVESQITIGAKILSLQNGLLIFKDSLCFLPFPLASFPGTFGLTELSKGFFPHLFNKTENQNYRGPMPDPHYYDPEGMSAKKKQEFLRWHSSMVDAEHIFDMKQEMEKYCISDVKLLKAGCEKFQEEFASHADFNPMDKCITIASACNRFWRKKLLPRDTIAIEPPRGWHGATTNTSLVARQWLAYRNHRLRMQKNIPDLVFEDPIKTSTNGGEVRIRTPAESFLVDGYDADTNTVYEFHGCLWHGCPTCYPKRETHSNVNLDRSFQEVFEATKIRENTIRLHGYNLITMWECQWKTISSTRQSAIDFVKTWKPIPPLNPRNAFFGGRTNAACLYHKAEEDDDEKIFYVDVTSLYPWVNAEAEYPVGHPIVITNPQHQDISRYFGVAQVDVVPPFGLYHPVLPHRHGGKLTFPLCATCVTEEMPKRMTDRTHRCNHTDEQRMLTGTWCTPELLKAIEKGYRIIRIHEVWHFESRVKGLFKDYVNTWLKVKQESSGYPAWADSDEKKARYRQDYKTHQDIDLDPVLIDKNAGRKATAKLMLNSFWGKFGENLNKQKVHSVTDTASLFTLLYDNLDHVERIRICNDDLVEVVVREHQENQIDNGRRNIFIAAFTTCHARLKLYQYLDLLKEQVLYFDTDSVIYRCKPTQPKVPLGDYLGEMTDELEGDDHIIEFVSGGPKNYGYKTKNGKVCCKVRGFTLNVRGSNQLNYDVMKTNVLREVQEPVDARRLTDVHNPHFFTRDPTTKRLRVIPRTKQYSLVFDKRVVESQTFMSYPYGYTEFFTREDQEVAENLLSLLEL